MRHNAASDVIHEARYVLVTRLGPPILAFFLLILIGRQSNQLLGAYAIVTTFFFVMQTLPLLGLAPFAMREVARAPASAGRVVGTVGPLALLASAGINLATHWGLSRTPYTPEIQQAIVVVGYTIYAGILAFLADIVLISLHRARLVSYVTTAENALRLAGSMAALAQGGGIVALMWVLFFTRLLALCAYTLIFLIVEREHFTLRFDPALIRRIAWVLPVFMAGTVLGLVVSRMDYIVLSLNRPMDEIGYYAIAYRLLEIALMAFTAIVTALYPRLARLYVTSRRSFRQLASLIFRSMLALLLVWSFCGAMLSDRYVAWLFARQYPHPVALTQGFIVLLVISGLDIFMASLLNAADRQARDLVAMAIGSACYAALLLALIPPFGSIGAVVAYAVAMSAQLTARIIVYRRHVGSLHWVKDAVRVALPGVILFSSTWLLTHQLSTLWIVMATLAAVTAYVAIVLIFGLLRLAPALIDAWPRREGLDRVRDIKTPAGLCDHLAEDLRAWRRMRARGGRGERAARIGNYAVDAVVLYRLSRFALLNGHGRIARLISRCNVMLTKAELPPTVEIGPGLFVTHTVGIIVLARAGCDLKLGAWAALGRRGRVDVGEGAGIPSVGDRVSLMPRAAIQGGMFCASDTSIPAAIVVRYARELQRYPPRVGNVVP